MAAAALTTVFTPPSWCHNRYAVEIATPSPLGGAPSTLQPSSGWVDPKFSSCIPSQYTSEYPTFSPGVCPSQMQIVSSGSSVKNGKTTWTGACCQSGFSTLSADSGWLCTSSVTTPMAFLLDPNITTTDVYTTLSDLWIEHDQITVEWQATDLSVLPNGIAGVYASIMGISQPIIQSTTATGTSDTTSTPSPASKASTTTMGSTRSPSTTDSTSMGTSETSEGSRSSQTAGSSTSQNMVTTSITTAESQPASSGFIQSQGVSGSGGNRGVTASPWLCAGFMGLLLFTLI